MEMRQGRFEDEAHAAPAWRLLARAASRTEKDLDANEEVARANFQRWPVPHFRELSHADLSNAFGLDRFESRRLLAAMELGVRIGASAHGVTDQATGVQEAFQLFRDLADERQEHFVAAYLDAKANVIERKTIHKGTVTASLVGAREVFREAVKLGAASVIVAHNHPSGDPEPSPEDIEVTKNLREAGELLDVPVLDHIIVGKNGRYTSLHERGLMGR